MNLPKFACFALLAAVAVACGNDAKSTADAAASETVSTDAAATDSADASAGKPDTATAPQDTATAPQDTAPPQDTAVGTECYEMLPCFAKCVGQKDMMACATACAKDGTADGLAKASAIGTCAQKNCASKAPGMPMFACLTENCYAEFAKCGDWAGTASCPQVAGCVARCAFNDDACRFACLPKADPAITAAFGKMSACGAEKCGNKASADEMVACLASDCTEVFGACKGAGWNCAQVAACHAKCPPPAPDKPNACQQTCSAFATQDGLDKEKALVACKADCKGVLDFTKCINDNCKDKRTACFVDDGADNCNSIFKCVNANCKGIGGDSKCIGECVKKGSAQAKDGWVYYEGCMTLALESAQATQAKCKFPYDLTTCINQINGFCSNQHDSCFKPQ